MPKEIERKFLTRTEEWRLSSVDSVRLRDGLIASANGRKVRVRIAGERASLTVKGARQGLERDEYEYPVPLEDAEEMLARHCEGLVVTKTRHYVMEDGCRFEVDVYDSPLNGIVIAEVELSSSDQSFPRPAWLGDEVTGREEYRKINLLRAHLRKTG